MEWLLNLLPSLTDFLSKHPQLMAVLAVIGGFRLIFKPLFTFLHAVADMLPGDKDSKILDDAENSQFYKALSFVLDLLASIKLRK